MAALKLTLIYQCLQDNENNGVCKTSIVSVYTAKQRNVVETKHCTMTKASCIKFAGKFQSPLSRERNAGEILLPVIHLLIRGLIGR